MLLNHRFFPIIPEKEPEDHQHHHHVAGRDQPETTPLGRAPTVGEAGELVRLEAAFAASGYRVKALLAAIALSDGLRTIAAPGED